MVRELAIPASELIERLSSEVAQPGRSWLSPAYQRGPWLEGHVSNSGFVVWLKRPRRGGPLARARGQITDSPSGCTVSIALPTLPSIPGPVLAVALFGWLTSFPIVLVAVVSGKSLPWGWAITLAFGFCAMVLLFLSFARAEAQELESYLGTLLDRMRAHAA